MGIWGSFLDWIAPEAKDVTFTPADAGMLGGLPRTGFPYGRSLRGGLDSNVVMAPVQWMCRNFTQAEVIVERRNSERSWSEAVDHPLKMLLDRPNDFYDGDMLWKATLVSRELDGNAYWRKVRNAFGEVIQLWYLPHFLVEPKWPNDGSEFISHYEYRPFGTGSVDIQPRDIIHFRSGLDPRNPRLGMSSLKPLLREVFTDEEASNFSAAILRNMGVPGGVLSPKDQNALPKSEDIKEMKEYMRTAFTGDKRGEWFVTGIPTEIKQFGFDPSQLLLTNLRDITEERVCAMLGIPAAVVGFGSGLQSTKVGATMRELREEAWASGIEPRMRTFARAATDYLVPDFQSQARRYRVRFDTSRVPALMERNANVQGQLVKDGIQRVDRAQDALGLEVDDSQAVYLRPSTTLAVPAETEIQQPTPPTPNANGRPPVNRLEEMMASENGGSDE